MAEVTPSGSGGPLDPVDQALDGQLSIRGGVAGVSFQFEELMAGARALDALSVQLTGVEIEARRIWEDLSPYQYDPRASGTAALNALGDGCQRVRGVRDEIQHISSQVRASYQAYEFAEAQSALALRLGSNSLLLVPQALEDVFTGGAINREAFEAATGSLPLTLGLLMGISPVMFTAALAVQITARKGVSAVGNLVRGLVENVLPMLKPRPVKATSESTTDAHVDTSPAGLLARAGAVDAAGQGKIEVINVSEEGKSSFIVIIPGTEHDGLPGGNNPFDEAGIAEGLGYESKHINEAIRSALSQAGAEADAQVVAVGYSQGGIHAMNLSQDKAFLAEYDLKYVLTAGSPVGGIKPEPGISSLHLEHRQDWVPGSDGIPSPDTKDRVTVTLTDQVKTAPGEEIGMGPGHKLSNYEAGAREVSASGNQSLLATTATLAGVVGVGRTAKVTRFQLERIPKLLDRKATVSVPPEVGLPRGR